MQIQPKKIELCKTLELFSDNITHVHDKNDWMMVQTAKQHRALEKFTLPCIFVIYAQDISWQNDKFYTPIPMIFLTIQMVQHDNIGRSTICSENNSL